MQAPQMQVSAERVAVMKMAPRRPNQLLRGAVSQHPRTAQQSCVDAKCQHRAQKGETGETDVGGSSSQAEKPLVVGGSSSSGGRVGVETKLRRPCEWEEVRAKDRRDQFVEISSARSVRRKLLTEQVCSICNRLIHALHGCRYAAHDY